MLRHRIRAAREHGELFQLEVLSGGREQRTLDQAWLLLMQAADIEDAPVGRLFDSETGGPRSYAMAVPLYDAAALELPRRHPARKPVANIGMRRDTGYIDAEVAATARRIVPLFVIVVIGVALGVRFALRQTVRAAAAPPGGRHRRRRQGRPVARHPGRTRRRDRHHRRAVQRHDRLAARGARGRRARRQRAAGPGGAPAPRREAGDHRPDGGGDRARAGDAAQRHRRAGAGADQEGGRRGRGDQERRPDLGRGRAHHQDHPPGARLLAAARADADARPAGRGRRRGAGVRARDGPAHRHQGRARARRRRRPRSPAIPIRSSRSA